MTRAPAARYRKPVGQIAPVVAELDPLQAAGLEESLSWARQGHTALHEASRYLAEALSSGQVSIAESARQELVRAITAAAQSLANL